MKSSRINYVVVGGFVIAMLVGLVASIALLTGRTGATDEYHIIYRNVTGLKFGTQVLFEGFTIGQVEKISPEPQDSGMTFRVGISVTQGWRIPEDSLAQITASGLLAAVGVNINAGPSTTALAPGSEIRSKEAANIFAAMSTVAGEISELTEAHIKPLLVKLSQVATTFSNLLENDAQVALKQLTNLMGDVSDRTPRIIDNIEGFSEGLNQTGKELALLLRKENREKLEAIVENLNQSTDQMRLFFRPENREKLESITDNIEQTSEELKMLFRPENRRKLEAFIANLDATATTVADMARGLKGTQKKFDELLESVNSLVDKNAPHIDKSVIALRRILDSVSRHIDTINQNLDGTARNLYEFSRQIRQNPGLLLGGRPQVDRAKTR